MSPPILTPDELQRYARHLTLPEVGREGQERLRRARVLVVGAGGLGSPTLLYLAAAGVGTLGIVDDDLVDISNLQRQILHDTPGVGRAKTESAAARLKALNPHVTIEQFSERLTATNARAIIRSFDLVVDGSDNFPTRYLVNDACVLEKKPFVYGSIYRFDGQLSLFAAPGGPCYRCLFAEPPAPELVPSCVDAGVLGVLPGIIGTLQALEALKWLLGKGRPAVGRLLMVDTMALTFREIAVARDPACVVCGDHPTLNDLIDYEAFCGVGPLAARPVDIGVKEFAAALRGTPPPVIVDVREGWEYDIAHLENSLLVPLAELPDRLGEIPARAHVVTVCHHGMRSQAAADLLRRAGWQDARSLTGGVDAWAEQMDREMRRY